jgi:hypothetical protein
MFGKHNRVTFFLNTTLMARIARRLAKDNDINVSKTNFCRMAPKSILVGFDFFKTIANGTSNMFRT